MLPLGLLESTDRLSEEGAAVATVTHNAWNDIIKDDNFRQLSEEQRRRNKSNDSQLEPAGIENLPKSLNPSFESDSCKDSAPLMPEGAASSADVRSSFEGEASSAHVRSSYNDPLVAGVKKATRRGEQRYKNKNPASPALPPIHFSAQTVEPDSYEQGALDLRSTETLQPGCEEPSQENNDRCNKRCERPVND